MSKPKLLSTDNYTVKDWKDKFPSGNIDVTKLDIDSSWNWAKKILEKNSDVDKINKIIDICVSKDKKVFPYPDLVFNAFNSVDYEDVKVVIVGQDSYMNEKDGIPEAMGMSFSIPVGTPIPSSLNNIYKNAVKFKQMFKYPEHGNLQFWANQGVLLINSALTVQQKCAGSHIKQWSKFTDQVIEKISKDKDNLVFVLWGGYAAKKRDLIDMKKHKVIVTSHPSGLSVNTPYEGKSFANFDHFGQINKYLEEMGKTKIIWQII
jgi:uracil-DNA glycosylase